MNSSAKSQLNWVLAPSRPSKHPVRAHPRPHSPLHGHGDLSSSISAPTSLGLHPSMSGPSAWKIGSAPNVKAHGINLVEKIQPLSFVLQPPEEQTDNWDDDFEEGISFTKLQGIHSVCHSEICLY